MSYDQFLHATSQQKGGMDRRDGVCYLRMVEERGRSPMQVHGKKKWFKNNEDSMQNNTELHKMRVKEQTKMVQEMNKM